MVLANECLDWQACSVQTEEDILRFWEYATYIPGCHLSLVNGATEKKVYVVLIDQKAKYWWWTNKVIPLWFLFISLMIDHTTERKKNVENK